MSSDRSMIWASRHRRPAGAPWRIHANTGASSGYTEYLRVDLARSGPPALTHGYLQIASRVARVRLRPAGTPPAPMTLGSRRVTTRRVWALPSNPPIEAAAASRARSPLCPKGGCPRSWDRHAASTTSGSAPSSLPSSRPTWATSRECVRRVRTKSSEIGPSTCVFSPRRRSAEEWRMRARSRSNSVRSEDLWSSGTQRSESAAAYGRRASPPSTPGIAKENSFTGPCY